MVSSAGRPGLAAPSEVPSVLSTLSTGLGGWVRRAQRPLRALRKGERA